MIKSFLQNYILPREVDFISGLQAHSLSVHKTIRDLYLCFIKTKEESCSAIIEDEHEAQCIREKNMQELLDAFITPIDRESIYRVISQLDWIAVSVRHFVLEAKAYEITTLENAYIDILSLLKEQSLALNQGFVNLKKSNASLVAKNAQSVRDNYEKLIELHIQKMADIAKSNNMRDMFIQREILLQLKEISKRLQICANSLEDIVIKMN